MASSAVQLARVVRLTDKKKKKKKGAADVCMSLSGWAWSELRRRAANLASFPRIPYRLHQLIMI